MFLVADDAPADPGVKDIGYDARTGALKTQKLFVLQLASGKGVEMLPSIATIPTAALTGRNQHLAIEPVRLPGPT